jgi:4-carboxymuconolactone decarboxylase
MSNSEEQEFGRLPLLKQSELTTTQASLRQHLTGMLEWADRSGFRAQTDAGELLGPFNSLLYSPEVAEGLLSFIQAETRGTGLPPQLREVVILTVGSVWNAAYELYAHRAVAQSLGITSRDVELLSSGKAPVDLGPDGELVQRFVLSLTQERHVSNALYEELTARFDTKVVFDTISLVGIYMTVSALLNAFEVPAG